MPRKTKTNRIGPLEEAENAKALDAAAGIPTAKEVLDGLDKINAHNAALPPVDFSKSTTPPLTYDSREKLLLKYASEKWVDGFFADFTNTKELSELTCRLGMRVLASIICSSDPEFADTKDKIAAMRVVLNIEYGENASMSPEKFLPPPPVATIPTGGTEGIEASVAKFKKFSGK